MVMSAPVHALRFQVLLGHQAKTITQTFFFLNLKTRCKYLYSNIKICCNYGISNVECGSYLQKLFSRARGSAPIILWASLDDTNKKGQSPLFGNNLWMEWIQERHFAKAAKSSNVTGNVPSSAEQLHSQRLLGNKDKWSLSAPEVLIFSLSPSLSFLWSVKKCTHFVTFLLVVSAWKSAGGRIFLLLLVLPPARLSTLRTSG